NAARNPDHPMTPFVPLFVDRCQESGLTVAEMYFEHIFPAYTRSNTAPVSRVHLGRHVRKQLRGGHPEYFFRGQLTRSRSAPSRDTPAARSGPRWSTAGS